MTDNLRKIIIGGGLEMVMGLRGVTFRPEEFDPDASAAIALWLGFTPEPTDD